MNRAGTDGAIGRRLRLWPGVVIVALQWLARFALPAVFPETTYVGVMAGVLGGLAVAAWWLLFSRAPWIERLGALVLMAAALSVTPFFLHESIATGAMGMLFYLYAVPLLSLAFVAVAVVTRGLDDGPRRAAMAAAIVLACATWTLLRTGGFTGDADSDFAWRWAPTPEERLLASEPDPLPPLAVERARPLATGPEGELEATAQGAAEPVVGERTATLAAPMTPAIAVLDDGGDTGSAASAVVAEGAENGAPAPALDPPAWPGFRGPRRDGVARGVAISTDWAASPPVELWRRPIGPGWSSFAVDGERIYTQEQRGDDELVSCYRASNGEPLWRHRDAARFWESNGGAGPRGTPTLAGGAVYTLGGTGIVNALDAATGERLWSRDAAADTGAELPIWGFSASPLVVGDLVVVAASGRLIAYDAASGEPRWRGPQGGEGYSSPQLAALGESEQILQLSGDGLVAVSPADGAPLWEHAWKGYPIVQPAQTADGDLLLGVNADSGLRRLAIAPNAAGGWSVEERWTSTGLKPYFNDFVVHRGHAYGFDGGILSCIELERGERRWKGGRYGHGQLLLLPEQDLLLVLSEKGELALVSATPDGFGELARHPAFDAKTWNHPVLAGDLLLVRNGEEMAAFRLPRAAR